jgi:hypothetical protein
MQQDIYVNENIKIIQQNNRYKIEFKNSQYQIIHSLLKTRILRGGSTNETFQQIFFKADKIRTLEQYLCDRQIVTGKNGILVSDIAKIIRTLVCQLQYLIEKEGYTIIGYNPKEIIVINDDIFVFINGDLLSKIDKNTHSIQITFPFTPNDFFISPELLCVKSIPATIHYKTAYFSLAILIIYILLGDVSFYMKYIDTHLIPISHLLKNHPILNTKIYWLLSRCLLNDPKDRSILLI